jgi:lysophospholipase L1-like esterase
MTPLLFVFHRRRLWTLFGVLLLTASSLASDLRANSPPQSSSLTAEEQQVLGSARAAVLELPEIKAATAKFNEARKAYQEDRRKFPADRDKSVQQEFRKVTIELEAAKQKALLASNPSLKPLLDKEAVAKRKSSRGMNEGETLADSDHRGNPAVRPIQDVAGLPRVLIIGDSISIGYTLQVRKLLEGRANVHRIPVNAGATEVGLANMKKWLGNGKWDVIHFNFGLHDAKHSSATEFRSSREQYAENLRQLIALMKPTGAKLIFATTTPVPKDGKLSPTRIFDDIEARNDIAEKVMSENGVAIDDLYGSVLPQIAEVGRPNDVHFKPEGYDVLAKAVANSIEAQLPGK